MVVVMAQLVMCAARKVMSVWFHTETDGSVVTTGIEN